MGIRFVRQDELPTDVVSRDLVGEKFGGSGVCVLFVDVGPGEGRLRQIDIHLGPRFDTEWLE